jgi:hypothetical protein
MQVVDEPAGPTEQRTILETWMAASDVSRCWHPKCPA